MLSVFDAVKEFHERFNVAIDNPFTGDLIDLRSKLMYEELNEVDSELYPSEIIPTDRGPLEVELPVNKKKLTKELADLIYVTVGTAISFGLPLEAVFNEVHRSNLSKLGEDGRPIYREDGKVLKGPNYQEAQLDQFFE